MDNAEKLGADLLNTLRELSESAKILHNPRGLGFMCAVDVVSPRTNSPDPARRNRVAREAFDRGIIVLPCGESGIRFCPPLCINKTQLEVGLKLFAEAVQTVG